MVKITLLKAVSGQIARVVKQTRRSAGAGPGPLTVPGEGAGPWRLSSSLIRFDSVVKPYSVVKPAESGQSRREVVKAGGKWSKPAESGQCRRNAAVRTATAGQSGGLLSLPAAPRSPCRSSLSLRSPALARTPGAFQWSNI